MANVDEGALIVSTKILYKLFPGKILCRADPNE